MEFRQDGQALVCRRQGETLRIEPWGKDGLRVRATMYPHFTDNEWALTVAPGETESEITYSTVSLREGDGNYREYPTARITNGRISALVNHGGVIRFYRVGKLFLQEYYANYGGSITKESHCMKIVNRE